MKSNNRHTVSHNLSRQQSVEEEYSIVKMETYYNKNLFSYSKDFFTNNFYGLEALTNIP